MGSLDTQLKIWQNKTILTISYIDQIWTKGSGQCRFRKTMKITQKNKTNIKTNKFLKMPIMFASYNNTFPIADYYISISKFSLLSWYLGNTGNQDNAITIFDNRTRQQLFREHWILYLDSNSIQISYSFLSILNSTISAPSGCSMHPTRLWN